MHFKSIKYDFRILHVYEHVSKHVITSLNSYVLSGLGAPGVVRHDQAYYFHPYSYGRNGYPTVFYIRFICCVKTNLANNKIIRIPPLKRPCNGTRRKVGTVRKF